MMSTPQLHDPAPPPGLIGNTPLLRLRSLEPRPGVEVYAKAEWTNPGGSVKDRAALSILRAGERAGVLRPGMTVLDASSGNTGIAFAMLGAHLGYPVEIVMPDNAGVMRRRLLAAWGAHVLWTAAEEGMDGAIALARRRALEHPGDVFYANQYDNPANWRAHYEGTGPEILVQTGGRVTHFVAGLGTTGTFTGVGRRLRESVPGVTLVAMQPDSPLHALEGLKHLASVSHVPRIYDPGLAARTVSVSTEDAQRLAFRLQHAEGILVGPSAAAAAVAAERVARELEQGVVVTVFADNADKYLGEPFWSRP
jgi:cysteine synthase B